MANSKCEHPSCNCPTSAGQRFCSDACKELAGIKSQAETRCGCDHKDCAKQSA